MVDEPRLLSMIKEVNQQQELLQLEGLDGCLITRPVAVWHGGMGMGGGYVWVIQESGG